MYIHNIGSKKEVRKMNGKYIKPQEIRKKARDYPLTAHDLAVKRANKKLFYQRWGY